MNLQNRIDRLASAYVVGVQSERKAAGRELADWVRANTTEEEFDAFNRGAHVFTGRTVLTDEEVDRKFGAPQPGDFETFERIFERVPDYILARCEAALETRLPSEGN